VSNRSGDGQQEGRIEGLTVKRPLGKLAPGMEAIGTAFANMWKELDKDPDKFGCTFALPSVSSTRHSGNQH
jgi:hypothetical protein